MGQPVVHFEVIGKDGPQLQRFFADLFGWKIDADNPLKYGSVEDAGIAGGIASGPTPDYDGHVTFYVGVPDVEAALSKGRLSAARGCSALHLCRERRSSSVSSPISRGTSSA